MPSPKTIMAILLLLTLAIASPTTSLGPTDSRHVMRQVAATTSLILPSIPTITIDILQPPYVSLHSITARDAQAPEPTTTISPPELIAPYTTVTLEGDDHGTSVVTYNLYITTVTSALYRGTQVPVASSADGLALFMDFTRTSFDCTAVCGALNEIGECSHLTECNFEEEGVGKGGRPPLSNGAGRMTLSDLVGGGVTAAMVLVIGAGILL